MKSLVLLTVVLLSINSYAKKHNYDPQMAKACENACSMDKNIDEKLIKSQLDAKEGDLVRCPVSGVVIKVKRDSETVDFKGKKIRTCCAGCTAKFLENPDKFAKNIN